MLCCYVIYCTSILILSSKVSLSCSLPTLFALPFISPSSLDLLHDCNPLWSELRSVSQISLMVGLHIAAWHMQLQKSHILTLYALFTANGYSECKWLINDFVNTYKTSNIDKFMPTDIRRSMIYIFLLSEIQRQCFFDSEEKHPCVLFSKMRACCCF